MYLKYVSREYDNEDEVEQGHSPDCFCQVCRPTWPVDQEDDSKAETIGAELVTA